MGEDYESEFGYKTFDRCSRFIGEHTPKPIMNAVGRVITDPKLRGVKVGTYGLMVGSTGIAIYGAVFDKPLLAAAGVISAGMGVLVEVVRRKALRSIEERVTDNERPISLRDPFP